jgi:hypothetical protein
MLTYEIVWGKGVGCKSVRRAKVRHQMNRGSFVVRGVEGKKGTPKKCREIMQIYHPSLPKKGVRRK